MAGTEWVRPGHGETLALLRHVFGDKPPEVGDDQKVTSLIFVQGRLDEHDRMRYEEVERRAAAGETL